MTGRELGEELAVEAQKDIEKLTEVIERHHLSVRMNRGLYPESND